MDWSKVIAQFLDWLEKNAPGLLGALGLGYSMGSKGKEKLENEVINTQLELDKANNKNAVDDANRGKSDADIVFDAINETRSNKPH